VDFLNRNGRLIKDNGAPVINDTGLALEDEDEIRLDPQNLNPRGAHGGDGENEPMPLPLSCR